MAERSWQFYAALVASTISVVGWIGALVGIGYTLYTGVTGGPVVRRAILTAASFAIGAVFAIVENGLYRIDEEQ